MVISIIGLGYIGFTRGNGSNAPQLSYTEQLSPLLNSGTLGSPEEILLIAPRLSYTEQQVIYPSLFFMHAEPVHCVANWTC